MSALRVPLPQAVELITQRIEIGREFTRRIDEASSGDRPLHQQANITFEELDALWNEVARWSKFNFTWIHESLDGEARTGHYIGEYDKGRHYNEYNKEPSNRLIIEQWNASLRHLRSEISKEIQTLESVLDRLPIWAPKSAIVSPRSRTSPETQRAPIFIVHGSDTLRAESVAHTVATATGCETIILRDQPNLGRTLIEKFEQHAAEVSYAVIILTADDQGSRADEIHTRPRGRQNVIFEMGYFYGLIGRGKVSVLLRPGVEKPSDMDGIAYIAFDDNRAWKNELLRELKHAGFDIHL
jgi:predicted nucleotide-binding protein